MRALVTLFVQAPIRANVLIITVVTLGLIGYGSLRKAVFPDVEPSIISITTSYPGASPEEVETAITEKIEAALKGLRGIEEISSESSESYSSIIVEVKFRYDPNEILVDVKNSVDRTGGLPAGAERPSVYLNKRLGRGITLALTGSVPYLELKKSAYDVERQLLQLPTVSQVQVRGLSSVEYLVAVDLQKLRSYDLSIAEVARALKAENQDRSGGRIQENTEDLLVRTRGRQIRPQELEATVIRTDGKGSSVHLRDLGTVRMQLGEEGRSSSFDGAPAITVDVRTLPEEDVLQLVKEVKAYIAEYNVTAGPLTLEVQDDRSVYLNQRLDLLINNGMLGLILVLILLGLFIHIKVAGWVAFSIPFSFLGMFFVATLAGITINVISLFGMILVIGILVDDGIVIGENIFSQVEQGVPPKVAAIEASLEVLPSVLASVLTTMLAFVPFFFLEGRIGSFMNEMAVIVIACLGFSLVDAFFILPSHLSHFKKRKSESDEGARVPLLFRVQDQVGAGLGFARTRIYLPVAKTLVRWHWPAVAGAISLILISVGLVKGQHIQQTFFPYIDSDSISISVVLPAGTPQERTAALIEEIKQKTIKVNEQLKNKRGDDLDVIEHTVTTLGTALGESGTHTATLNLKLLSAEDRDMASFEISNLLRSEIGPLPEAEKFVLGGRRMFGKAVSISLRSDNLSELREARLLALRGLREREELKDVADSSTLGRREIILEPLPLARQLGLTREDLISAVRSSYFGQEVDRYTVAAEEARLWVRLELEDRSLSVLGDLEVPTSNGGVVPLRSVARFESGRSPVSIQHVDGQREIQVEADLVDQDMPVPPLLAEIKSTLFQEIENLYPSVVAGMVGQQKESNKFAGSAMRAFPLALLAGFLMVSLVFGSFLQSFLVMLMIPFGIAGAIYGHGFEGKPLSLLSIYGLLALAGVVINDAVVFVDRVNRQLAKGTMLKDAVIEAGQSRFRAILLTSLTTIAGLYPVILEKSRQGQFLVPMAIAIAYGVFFATLSILIFLPPMLLCANDLRRSWYWLRHGRWPSREEVEPSWIGDAGLASEKEVAV